MKTKLLFAALAAAISAGSAMADKVTLKSGSVLTGSAGTFEGDALNFASDDLGDMKIPVDKIASLESDAKHVIEYVDRSRESDKSVTVKDGDYVVDGQKLDKSKVKAIDPGVETWHGSVNVAYESNRGNTYKNNATVLADISRRWEEDRVKANFGYYYSETGTSKQDKEKSTDRWEVEGQHDHFWSEKFYSYENGKYEQDDIAGIDYRLRLGLGVGYQWLDKFNAESTGIWSFNQEVGGAWVKTDYVHKDPDADDSYASLRYAHHLNYVPKWATGVEVFHNLEYMPQVDDWENYLMKADVGITTKIIFDFDLIAKIEWEYNSRPSLGRKSSDTRYIVGLGYKW
ncbi:MAG: DUF481 domain-containing protein [Kiritimatiellae bacterium]|nr:DUF481 domain-containing protein [Kiritimatiellia bacterium]